MSHPITEQIRKQVEQLEEAKRNQREAIRAYTSRVTKQNGEYIFNGVTRMPLPDPRCQPVYVLDENKNIIARLEAKHLVRAWYFKHTKKTISDKTVYRALKSGSLFKKKYYLVPVEEYEIFMEKN